MAKMKWMLAAITIVVSAGVVCAHLPSIYDARFQIDRERLKMAREGMGQRNTFGRFSSWNPNTEYGGDYTIYQGDTVQHGSWNGIPLLWWAKFWSKGDEPGTLGTGGGTSPWVLINSHAVSANAPGGYQWSGWGSQARGNRNINVGDARVATWRNGAEGAYSFTHDDIGPMPFHLAIKPAYDLSKETGFEEIKQGWGVFVNMMSPADWDNAVAMVRQGHEMFNHSMYHTSAADQYQWFYNQQTVPDFDPSIPYAIRGLTVRSLWGNVNWPAPWDNGADHLRLSGQNIGMDCDPRYASDPIRILTLQDAGIRIEGPAYWTGMAFNTDNCIRGKVPMTITPLGNTQRITLPSGMEVFVSYEPGGQADIAGLPADGSENGITNRGILYATTPAWLDPQQLDQYGENGWSGTTVFPNVMGEGGPASVQADQGSPGLIASIFTVAAWGTAHEFRRNMGDANDSINKRIYERISNPGIHFARGKRSEYYGYPFDAYSLTTHDSLSKYGIPQARGGSKTPQVMKGDFFHPYAIDFDAFYITRPDWTPAREGQGWVYPDNPHVWLGLNQMVDSIVYHKGYMIREFHSVGDIANDQWFLDAQGRAGQPSNTWKLNSPAAQAGGWWGGITKNQLRIHYEYMRPMIDDGRLVVFTPSEAVKYRLSANAVSGVNLNRDGNEWTLTPTLDNTRANTLMIPQQRDEITVIVGIDNVTNNQLNVVYADNPNESPRLRPRKLPGNDAAWAINFNPFVSGSQTAQPRSVRLIPNQPFTEPGWDGPDHEIGDGPDTPCDPFTDPNCDPSGTIGRMATRGNNIAFTGIHNGQINLRLAAGNYTAELYNLQGRLINRVNINAVNGVNATGLRTDNLAKGMLILNVRNAKGASVLQHKIMVR